MSEKHKKARRNLNYFDHSLLLSGCASISAFASLVGVPLVTANSAVG